MRARKWGRIITVISSGVIQPVPILGISNTLRAALVGWSKTLSAEIAPTASPRTSWYPVASIPSASASPTSGSRAAGDFRRGGEEALDRHHPGGRYGTSRSSAPPPPSSRASRQAT